jgi:hypothetical protein
MEKKLYNNRQFTVIELSGSSIRVPGSFSFLFNKGRPLGQRRIERETRQNKTKRNVPSFRTDTSVITLNPFPRHPISDIKLGWKRENILDFFLDFSNLKQVMYQHANNVKQDRYVL